MTDRTDPDLSKIAPHRYEEVLRRIRILDDFVARRIDSHRAIAELGMAQSTFYVLARAWRKRRHAEDLIGTGKPRKPSYPMSDDQKAIISAAEAELPDAPMTTVMARAVAIADGRGVAMAGARNMKPYIRALRRSRGTVSPGLADGIVLSCAIDVPVQYRDYGLVAPVATMVFQLAEKPTILGMHLSMARPTAAAAAHALLDAIRCADSPRTEALDQLKLFIGGDAAWKGLQGALDGSGIPMRYEQARPRIWRNVTGLIGERPGGLRLKPDLTVRRAVDRLVKLPRGGEAVSFEVARDLIGAALRSEFSGLRQALILDEVALARLVTRLESVAVEELDE
jgi:hypothetical protein